MPTVHLIIKGRVQGVFYRATAREVADEIGIVGWVKNTEEGNVEIKASGSEDQIQKMIEWARRGPRKAIVTDVIVTQSEEETFNSFEILRG